MQAMERVLIVRNLPPDCNGRKVKLDAVTV
jgi:hypothetical protein